MRELVATVVAIARANPKEIPSVGVELMTSSDKLMEVTNVRVALGGPALLQ